MFNLKVFAIVNDNIIQEVLHVGIDQSLPDDFAKADAQRQVQASMAALQITGEALEVPSDYPKVKGQYFDDALAPPPEEPEPMGEGI